MAKALLFADGTAQYRMRRFERWADLVAELDKDHYAGMVPKGSFTQIPQVPGGRTLFYLANDEKTVHVAELLPQVRSLMVQRHYNYPEIWVMRKIALPYLVVVLKGNKQIEHDSLYVYFRKAPVTRGDDTFGLAGLPNVNSNNGLVCPGTSQIGRGMLDDAPEDRLAQVVEIFFSSRFTLDHWNESWKLSISRVPGFPQSFDEWAASTQEDPSFILGLDWLETSANLQQFRQDGVAGHPPSFRDVLMALRNAERYTE